MKFCTEEACVSRSFVRLRMTWVEMENINEIRHPQRDVFTGIYNDSDLILLLHILLV